MSFRSVCSGNQAFASSNTSAIRSSFKLKLMGVGGVCGVTALVLDRQLARPSTQSCWRSSAELSRPQIDPTGSWNGGRANGWNQLVRWQERCNKPHALRRLPGALLIVVSRRERLVDEPRGDEP